MPALSCCPAAYLRSSLISGRLFVASLLVKSIRTSLTEAEEVDFTSARTSLAAPGAPWLGRQVRARSNVPTSDWESSSSPVLRKKSARAVGRWSSRQNPASLSGARVDPHGCGENFQWCSPICQKGLRKKQSKLVSGSNHHVFFGVYKLHLKGL